MNKMFVIMLATLGVAACGPRVANCVDQQGRPMPADYCSTTQRVRDDYDDRSYRSQTQYVPVPVYQQRPQTVIVQKKTVVVPARPVYNTNTNRSYVPTSRPVYSAPSRSTPSYSSRPSYSSSSNRSSSSSRSSSTRTK